MVLGARGAALVNAFTSGGPADLGPVRQCTYIGASERKFANVTTSLKRRLGGVARGHRE